MTSWREEPLNSHNPQLWGVQIHSTMLEMKFDEAIEAWMVLDLAQNRNSIVIFMNFHHLILARIHQFNTWSAQNQS